MEPSLAVVTPDLAAHRIRTRREERGLRLLDLAVASGLGLATVATADRHGVLTARSAEALASALELDPRSITPGCADPVALSGAGEAPGPDVSPPTTASR